MSVCLSNLGREIMGYGGGRWRKRDGMGWDVIWYIPCRTNESMDFFVLLCCVVGSLSVVRLTLQQTSPHGLWPPAQAPGRAVARREG